LEQSFYTKPRYINDKRLIDRIIKYFKELTKQTSEYKFKRYEKRHLRRRRN